MAGSSTAEQISKLRAVPLFAGLNDEALAQILEHATDFEAAPGHVLVQPNQPGAGLFVIEEGSVTVELKDRKIELGEGEFFGELALLDESAVHGARVCAATPLRALAISRDRFDELLENEPSIAKSMLRVLARRLSGMNV
ncbi:MAG: Crp/Fnr family transcriptional regulator [Actinomycetota bacterium]